MRFTTIFFDVDDTLYPADAGLWLAIKNRMNIYMRERLAIPEKDVPHLREKYYLQYGTTAQGLMRHHNLDVEDFMAFVHDLPLADFLAPDAVQRAAIAALPTRNFIFTNADIHHAERVLTALNLRDLFPTILDAHTVAPHCKPMPKAFEIAMQLAGEDDPARCVMIDDLARTTRAASSLGMFSILRAAAWTQADADAHFTHWGDLINILESA